MKDTFNINETVLKIVNDKNATLILKAIIHNMILIDWKGTQETINQAVENHHMVEEAELLDMKVKD